MYINPVLHRCTSHAEHDCPANRYICAIYRFVPADLRLKMKTLANRFTELSTELHESQICHSTKQQTHSAKQPRYTTNRGGKRPLNRHISNTAYWKAGTNYNFQLPSTFLLEILNYSSTNIIYIIYLGHLYYMSHNPKKGHNLLVISKYHRSTNINP